MISRFQEIGDGTQIQAAVGNIDKARALIPPLCKLQTAGGVLTANCRSLMPFFVQVGRHDHCHCGSWAAGGACGNRCSLTSRQVFPAARHRVCL